MPPIPQILKDLTIDRRLDTQHFSAQLLLGDARQTIRQVRQSGFLADAVFLDPFSPPRCPQLWTIEFIAQVASCIQPTGRLATYSCSAAVQAALLTAGLQIGATPPIARNDRQLQDTPLSQQEQEHLLARAAVPYRDPSQSDSAIDILQRRHQEQQQCQLDGDVSLEKAMAANSIRLIPTAKILEDTFKIPLNRLNASNTAYDRHLNGRHLLSFVQKIYPANLSRKPDLVRAAIDHTEIILTKGHTFSRYLAESNSSDT